MKRFKNILLVVDPELMNDAVFERAVALAQYNQARLTVVSVVEPVPIDFGITRYGMEPEKLRSSMIEAQKQQLQSLIDPVREQVSVSTKVLTGKPFLEVIREVLRANRDLIIKVAEGDGGLMAQLFGSTDMHLLRKSPCPVWLIKPAQAGRYKRILAAVDFDAIKMAENKKTLNRRILEMATSLALSESCELHIAHAWEALAERSLRSLNMGISVADADAYVEEVRQQQHNQLDGLLRELATWMGKDALSFAKPQLHLLKGNAKEEIPRLASELGVDLIVMGTLARAGVPGFIMGNTAETILNRIDCSVLAIKPENFVTPVELED